MTFGLFGAAQDESLDGKVGTRGGWKYNGKCGDESRGRTARDERRIKRGIKGWKRAVKG